MKAYLANKLTCCVCKSERGSAVGLVSHIKVHSISSEEYYRKYLMREGDGKCLSCGSGTLYHNFSVGFLKFCSHRCSMTWSRRHTNFPVWNKGKQLSSRIRRIYKKAQIKSYANNPSIKRKISDTVTKDWKLNYTDRVAVHCTKSARNNYREAASKRILSKIQLGTHFYNNKTEVIFQTALKHSGIKILTHKAMYGHPDVFSKPNICIFVDGEVWHNYPDGTKRDKYVDTVLKSSGNKVIRFWRNDIMNKLENCVSIVKREVDESSAVI